MQICRKEIIFQSPINSIEFQMESQGLRLENFTLYFPFIHFDWSQLNLSPTVRKIFQ
jgi:hypothetical protein